MTDRLMIKLEDGDNDWVLNLNYIVGVEYRTGGAAPADLIYMTDGRIITAPLGSFQLALDALMVEYSMGPVSRNASNHLYIGTTP